MDLQSFIILWLVVLEFYSAMDSRKSQTIDLYSDHTKNKLQALTFAAKTSVTISLQHWNLA